MNISFEELSDVSLNDIVEMVNDIFADYVIPIEWNALSFELDIRENSISLKDSFFMTVDGERVGICINGIRPSRARIDAFGILRRHRGKGYGTALLSYVLDDLKWKGANEVFLEVAKSDPAVSFYEKHDFRKRRILTSFYIEERLQAESCKMEAATSEEIHEMAVLNEKEKKRFPNWQREALTLKLSEERYNKHFIVIDGRKTGYVVWGTNPSGAYIVDIAPIELKDYERLMKSVLACIQREFTPKNILIMNVPQDDPLHETCVKIGMKPFFEQLEMVKF